MTAPATSISIRPQPKQALFLQSQADIAITGGGAGGGKLLPLDTPIPTPHGWKLNGDLVAGDEIFDDKGNICHVIESFPVETPKVAYELEFDDGTKMIAGEDHQWITFTQNDFKDIERRTPEFREKRRQQRPSRATGNRGPNVTAMLIARNKSRAAAF